MKKHNIATPDGLLGAGKFFGAARVQLRSGDFTVSAVTHANSRVVPLHAHSHAFFADSPRVQRREPHWLRRALERLHDDPANESLSAVAADLDLHPVHVSRMFKRHLGVTVSQYLRELRLQRAARALLESRKPLAELADDHGFADQSHMTRELLRATSWSPAKLRCECERLR